MSFKEGNRFWEKRSSHGRDPVFKNPKELKDACLEYFVWVEDNPLWEAKVFHNQGVITDAVIPKMRAMTIGGMCTFLDICQKTWANYRDNNDFLQVTSQIEEIIKDQKFSGAAADLLNANIIARDLGLSDKKETTGTFSITIPSKDAGTL